MDIEKVIAELHKEREAIDVAIARLERLLRIRRGDLDSLPKLLSRAHANGTNHRSPLHDDG
jgi:hypothetical protein